MAKAGLKAGDIEVIIDFSVISQDYVVPFWCMSNKIQADLSAKDAFIPCNRIIMDDSD
jgi:hypothetical protein